MLKEVIAMKPMITVDINPETRVHVTISTPTFTMGTGAWFPIQLNIQNASGTTASLQCTVPITDSKRDAWVELGVRTLTKPLTGRAKEVKTIWLRTSGHSGMRELQLSFNLGAGTQDLGFRSDVYALVTLKESAL